MTPRNILWALLALMLTGGMFEAQYAAAHVRRPGWWMVLFAFLLSFLPYYWYRLDSTRRGFVRPAWMTVAVVGLAPLGIPAYLAASRPPGARLKAIAGMLVFLLKMLATAVAGAIAFHLMPG